MTMMMIRFSLLLSRLSNLSLDNLVLKDFAKQPCGTQRYRAIRREDEDALTQFSGSFRGLGLA
jgi:hypothetical protein